MRLVFAVLCALCVAAPAACMHVARGRLQRGQQSTDISNPENRGSELRVNSGRLDHHGLDSSEGLEGTPRGNSVTDEVREPLLVKTEFVYNGAKQSRRQVSPSDESVGSEELFREESKEAEPERTTFTFVKRLLEGDAKAAADDERSEGNIGGTTGEEPQVANTNSVHKDDHDDDGHLLDGKSPEQDVDSPADGNLVRSRRGIVFVPAMKTIPEVLDMGRARCRHPQRLERGRVLCRPVW